MIVNSPFVGHFSPLHNAIVAARAAAAGAPPAYQIDNAAIFDSADSSYLARTLSAPTNNKIWAFSTWVKKNQLGAVASDQALINASADQIRFPATDAIQFSLAGGTYLLTSDALFRDISSHYHVFVCFDSTNGTASDRMQIWVNGARLTSFSAEIYPTLNYNSSLNSAIVHNIGRFNTGAQHSDISYSETAFIDGTVVTAEDFGEFDNNGVWQSKEYAGVYGTNGSHLDFADNTHFGNDVSGNNNDWTDSGFTTDHQVVDTPTNNYCTWSAIDKDINAVISDGALNVGFGAVANIGAIRGSFGLSSGKWYWEVTVDGTDPRELIGIMQALGDISAYPGSDAYGYGYFALDGELFNSGISGAYGATFTTNDVIGVALDMDAGTLHFYKNNVDQGEAASGLTGTWFPAFGEASTSYNCIVTADFGQRGFTYTPPSGFVALCTDNLPVPDILKGSDYFFPKIYSGNSIDNRVISTPGLDPDLVWIKNRDFTNSHQLYDSGRGVNSRLSSDTDDAENTGLGHFNSFGSEEFTLGDFDQRTNQTGNDYVAWCWNEGVTPGFDIVPFVGTGVAHAVNHSLGVVPDMIIVKNRNSATAKGWRIYHSANTSAPETDYLALDTDAATADALSVWNDVAPTSTQFTIGDGGAVNEDTKNLIAYLFAEVEGFSKFGSYTGNGDVDGPFLWCGFRPAFVLTKRTDVAGYWWIQDTSRSPYNDASAILFPNVTQIEFTSAGVEMDIVSNGFKLRHTSVNQNASGGTYIFAAFAEHPFKTARAR